MTDQKPIRILQVVDRMDRAGVETWLMDVLRSIDRVRFRMDFLLHTAEPCAYNDEIRALGSKIIQCPGPRKPWLYGPAFRRILREYGPYDVVHTHIHHYSGFVLRLAQREGVPLRIAHSHLDSSELDAQAGLLRHGYLSLTRRWIGQYRTVSLACSEEAALTLFGSGWRTDPSCHILYCGVDLAPFECPVDSIAARTELGIPPGTFVLGHVGRLMPQKNHAFLVEIAAEVAQREPNMRLLLVGVGPLRPVIEEQVARRGLADRVIFAGSRPDVPRLMRGAMDVFVFPSLYEGLGLALIQAQAAGLPSVISDVVPREADVVTPLVRRLPLTRSAAAWATEVLAVRERATSIAPPAALAAVERSAFNVQVSRRKLENHYASS